MNWKQTEFVHKCPLSTAWDRTLFYSNMYPPNTTTKWIDTDTPTNAINDDDITYRFNEYGFRSDSFFKPSQINILVNGCSLTVGVGVNENWSEKLKLKIQEHTGKTVTLWNIATSGASGDYVIRSLLKVANVANLIPRYIFVYWPPISRLELPDPNNDKMIWQSNIDHYSFPKGLVSTDYLTYNKVKNQNLAKIKFCKKNIFLFENKEDIYFDSYARDGQHPDEDWHERVAQMFFEQYIAK